MISDIRQIENQCEVMSINEDELKSLILKWNFSKLNRYSTLIDIYKQGVIDAINFINNKYGN